MTNLLEQRLQELGEEEKRAWANLNFICGARAEVERMLAELQKPAEAPNLVLSN